MCSAEAGLLVFEIASARYALRLGAVERVLPMMEATSLPGAPATVLGVIDVAGRIVPVMNLRLRFGLPARDPLVTDVLILAQTRWRMVALPADQVTGLIERADAQRTAVDSIVADATQFEGVVRLDDGLVLIHDVDRFLSATEQRELALALERRGAA